MRKQVEVKIEKGWEYYCDTCNKKFEDVSSVPYEICQQYKYGNDYDEYLFCSSKCLLDYKFFEDWKNYGELSITGNTEDAKDWIMRRVLGVDR